jgi:hypothetical protein
MISTKLINDLNDAYHQRTELSSSQVSAFLTDPVKWYHQHVAKDWPREEPTEAMQFGTNVHLMCAAGGPSALPIVGRPAEADFRKTEWKEWKKAQEANGKEVVDSVEAYEVIWRHLQASKWTKNVLETCDMEVEHVWDDEILGPCRCKFDAESPGLIVDWKTTDKFSEYGFVRSILDMAYDVRIALYVRGFRNKYGEEPHVVLVAIQKKPGYRIQPYTMAADWLDDAEAKLIQAVDAMQNFNIDAELNVAPKVIYQPRYAQLSIEEISE